MADELSHASTDNLQVEIDYHQQMLVYRQKPQMELDLHGGRLKKMKMQFKCF
jgi:hypothetical protein